MQLHTEIGEVCAEEEEKSKEAGKGCLGGKTIAGRGKGQRKGPGAHWRDRGSNISFLCDQEQVPAHL